MIGIGVGHTKDRAVIEGTVEVLATVDQDRDKIRCFECREYDYFAKECPTRQASREAELIQKDVQYGQRANNITIPTDGHRSR